ncbi:MAG: hypothetical protein AB1505_36345 [Candidatus Latescibacterota bacterium]
MIGISYHAGGMRDRPLEEVVEIPSRTGYDRYVFVETFPQMRMEKAQIAYDTMSAALRELGLCD